jgi:hypothetical protein
MEKLETLAIALCVSMFAGVAVYTIDILLPGDGLVQQAAAIRRSTHVCTVWPFDCIPR